MCEISIIVPVYKVEKYLRKCVDSILAQTFTDFEVILVDDGSPDNSGKICDEYAEKDNRVRVIHKENGGLSSARNAGIDVARGKYLGFV
ncbi:TPA: glycosyltransferase, partial [Enterococcus faecium]|nr:glycosyltransferase [Enterococcus faecium]